MSCNLKIALIASANLLLTTLAFSHSRLSVVAVDGQLPRLIPRNSSDANKGDAATPCGALNPTRGTNPVVLKASETVVVDFEETIDHSGTFQLNFSQMGQVNFTPLVPPQTDTSIPIVGTPNKGRFQFRVPNTPCTDCTIQFVQDMSGTQNYRACVDIIIINAFSTSIPAQPVGFAVTK